MIAIMYHVVIVQSTIILLLFVPMVQKVCVINVMVTVKWPRIILYTSIRIGAMKLVPEWGEPTVKR